MTGNNTDMNSQPVSRAADNQDHYSVGQLTTAELERTRRQLKANLGLINPDSPAQVPIQSHMRAIDAELGRRSGKQQAGEGCDPLAALGNEYRDWKIRRPGKYVADHRRLDVTLLADSVPDLASKLRAFTELIMDLP